jgi:hypothetical protein
MRYVTALIGLSIAFCLTACREEQRGEAPGSRPAVAVVPDLYGTNLDEAEERLDSLGIDYSVDSGDDEVLIEHLWTVCDQSPGPGVQARFVTLTVEHSCDD